jgi:putative ABC transport system permease protein
VAPGGIMLQLAVGCLAPVVAALWSVFSAARITVRQAISSYGLGTDFGGGPLDQLVARIRGLPRPLAISLRNTFRRQGRMALTQITLVIAGVMFISVMGVRDSLMYTLERFFASRGFSVYFVLQDPQRFERAEAMARSVPGVTRAELWNVRPVTFDLGRHRLNVSFWAAPEDTSTFKPEIVAGRWLRPGDGNVMVLNQKIAADEGLKVGDRLTLKLERGDSTWEIVGLVVDASNEQRTAYASREAFGRALHQSGRGTRLNVTADQNDLASLTAIEKQLRATFESNSMTINDSANIEQLRQRNMNQFSVVIYLLLAMSVLAGAVGGFGLMGTMSINVLERSKEIGVMRAIGAPSSTLVGIFVVEGVIVGLLSAAIAIPFSFPVAWLFAEAVGQAMLIKMDFCYSAAGLLLWLLIVVALSSLASLWPAVRAAQLSVRETLAYE